jgi:hypothetical protein
MQRTPAMENFDAVYYASPFPTSSQSLTLLALVFDTIHFPGVYLPRNGLDKVETRKEIDRIRRLGIEDIETSLLINAMEWALDADYLHQFCLFTGRWGYPGILEEGAQQLALQLEELIYGPPPPNFSPVLTCGFAKALPGNTGAGVNAPSWITYPANALVYSINNSLVLLNDNPTFPMPALGDVRFKNNAKALATVLALQSVLFALPPLKPLSPQEIVEFRHETAQDVKPFRRAMLTLSKELNAAILSDCTVQELQEHAKFLVETTVAPALEELRALSSKPTIASQESNVSGRGSGRSEACQKLRNNS